MGLWFGAGEFWGGRGESWGNKQAQWENVAGQADPESMTGWILQENGSNTPPTNGLLHESDQSARFGQQKIRQKIQHAKNLTSSHGGWWLRE
jgi:hypothetical protein